MVSSRKEKMERQRTLAGVVEEEEERGVAERILPRRHRVLQTVHVRVLRLLPPERGMGGGVSERNGATRITFLFFFSTAQLNSKIRGARAGENESEGAGDEVKAR